MQRSLTVGFEDSFRRHLAPEQRKAVLEVIARELSPTTTLGEIVDAAQELGWSEALGEYDLGELALALLGGRPAQAILEAAYEQVAEEVNDDDDDDDATAAPTDAAPEEPVDADAEEDEDAADAEAAEAAGGADDDEQADEPAPTKAQKRSKAPTKAAASRAKAKSEPAKTKTKSRGRTKAKPEPAKAKPEPAKAKAKAKPAKAKPEPAKAKPEPAKAKPTAKKVTKKVSKKEAEQELESFFPMLPIFAELDEMVGAANGSKKASKRAKKAAMYVAPEPADEGEGMSLEQAAKLLLPLVKRLKEATMQDLEAQTGMGRRKLRFHIGQLVKHGRLSRRGMGRGTTYSVIK